MNNPKTPIAVWDIEYEIPPLRDIYLGEVGPCTEGAARMAINLQNPQWRVRKLIARKPKFKRCQSMRKLTP